MVVIYDKKLVQLLNIKSQNNKPPYEQMYILCSCTSGSICIESLQYRWREKCGQRCEIHWYRSGAVIPRICVLRGAKISACWYCCLIDNCLVSWTPFASTPCGLTLPQALHHFPWETLVLSVFCLIMGKERNWAEICCVSTPTGSAPFSTQQNGRVEQLCRIHVLIWKI